MPNNKPSSPYHATPDEAFWVKAEDAPAEEKIKPKRHVFTREECQRGFWAAIESIISR